MSFKLLCALTPTPLNFSAVRGFLHHDLVTNENTRHGAVRSENTHSVRLKLTEATQQQVTLFKTLSFSLFYNDSIDMSCERPSHKQGFHFSN